MKQKLSITIDEEKIAIIEKLLEEGLFRSKSHILEYSLNKFLREKVENAKNI
jgi:Arc/MetJ-type ribon-helix-helix transcriptional regulator